MSFSNLFSLSTLKDLWDIVRNTKEEEQFVEEYGIQVGGRPARVLSDEQYKEYLKNRGKPQEKKISNLEQDKKLLNACYRGDMEAFNEALKNGADVNCSGYDSFYSQIYPLHLAAKGGHFEMVKKLVECGANIDVWAIPYRDEVRRYDTPIDFARRFKYTDIASYLQKELNAKRNFMRELNRGPDLGK